MADLDENIITVLEADAGVSDFSVEVFVNQVPESDDASSWVWIQMDDEAEPLDLGNVGGLSQNVFDIECTSSNIHTSKDLQEAVKTALHGKTGTFGDQNIAYAEITAKDDTYESRQPGDLKGLHVSALTLEIGVDGR